MQLVTFAIFALICGCYALQESTENVERPTHLESSADELINGENGPAHIREKRTLFLKKKLLGAGLLGFGLGVAKGYKAGYFSSPEVHHVYLSPPPAPVKYVEYIEKPVFVERIVERPAPIFKESQKDYSPYGSW